MKNYSLRLRLLLATLVWVLLAMLAAGWGLRGLFAQHIRQQLQDHLVLQLNQVSGAVRGEAQGQVRVENLVADPRLSTPLSGMYWQIDALPQGSQHSTATVARSRSLWDQSLNLLPNARWQTDPAVGYGVHHITQPEGTRLLAVSRYLHLPEEHTPVLRITVAADERLLAEPLQRFTTMLWFSLGTLAAGLLLAAAVQLQWVLRPLRDICQALAVVRAGQAQQLAGQYSQELQPLVEEFNHVLAANADMVQHARTQAGNLAHALNTPLSVLTNAAAHDSSPLGQLVQEQVARARQQVDYHLARARAQAAVRATGLACPVQPAVQALLRTTARLYPHIDFGLQDMPTDLAFKGEEQDLFEMLGNLLDNAGKWAYSQVRVNCQQQGLQLQVYVDDDGPGIPTLEQREHIFTRGQRLDEQAPGTGLGLHIVRDLACAYGGNVHAEAAPLGGLRLVLQLPLAQMPLADVPMRAICTAPDNPSTAASN